MSDCGVCLSYGGDGEPVDLSSVAVRRARMATKCGECHRPISVGDKYELAKGKCEGLFFDFRTCATCAEIRDAFACHGFVYGALWGDLEESAASITTGCFTKLSTPEAKQYLRDRWLAWKGLAA